LENVWLALIVAVPAMLSPLLLSWLTNRQARMAKVEDYARQDLVAQKAADAAKALLAANEIVATNAKKTNEKLDVIHTLVNSSMTSAMQSELDARRIGVGLMVEIIALKRDAGKEPTPEAQQAVESSKWIIKELEEQLADRLKQAKIVERMPGSAIPTVKDVKDMMK